MILCSIPYVLQLLEHQNNVNFFYLRRHVSLRTRIVHEFLSSRRFLDHFTRCLHYICPLQEESVSSTSETRNVFTIRARNNFGDREDNYEPTRTCTKRRGVRENGTIEEEKTIDAAMLHVCIQIYQEGRITQGKDKQKLHRLIYAMPRRSFSQILFFVTVHTVF